MARVLAFKVISADGHQYEIWSDGRVEGFGDNCIVFNHLPSIEAQAVADYKILLESFEQVAAVNNRQVTHG